MLASQRTWTDISYQAWGLKHWGFGLNISHVPAVAEPVLRHSSGPRDPDPEMNRLFAAPFLVHRAGPGLDGNAGESPFDLYPQGTHLRQVLSTVHYAGGGSWDLFIPHWLILLTVATAWLGLLFWRSRRRKKRMTNAEFANAE